MFLKKVGQFLEIFINKKIFGLTNIIENQYVIWLAKKSKPIFC